MGSIERSVNREAGLTVYVAEGSVSQEEIRDTIREFYEHGPITRNVLWDVSQAALTDFSAEDVRQIAHVPRKSQGLREGGKTAIVASTDLAFGLSRMYHSTLLSVDFPFVTQVFRNLETAQQWLAEDTPLEK